MTGGYILKRLDQHLIDVADRVSDHIARAMHGERVTAEIISFRPCSADRKSKAPASKQGAKPVMLSVAGRR